MVFIFYKNCHIVFFVITQNLIIYKSIALYQIFDELSLELNFKIIFIDNEKELDEQSKNLNQCLILLNRENLNHDNQFILDETPISIFRLIEKINIEYLKKQFNSQAEFKVKSYTFDLNSREMIMNNIKLKLTEKEIGIITYLFKSIQPISINELQKKVWGYKSDIETHTVETHVYRLRKKILNTFNDNGFITSEKNGYQIK